MKRREIAGRHMAEQKPIGPRILERTVETIEVGGEAAVRTHKIAAECGVTAPVLYRHFTDREGLIVAAQSERYRRTYARDEAELGAELRHRVARCLSREDLIDVVRWFFGTALSTERRDAVMTRIEVLGSAMTRPTLREAVAEVERDYFADVIQVFAVAREHGWVKTGFFSESIVAVWQGVVLGSYLPAIASGVLDTNDWMKAATEAMLHLMFDDPVAR